MKRSLFFCLILIGLTGMLSNGCVEKVTNIYTSLHNKTDHSISILLYKDRLGFVNVGDTIKLAANTSLQIGSGYMRGRIERKIFIVTQYEYLDSVVVIFDGAYRIAHYTYAPYVFAPKYYLISSPRNLDNAESYELTRKGRNNYMDYYFTEQDYLDAKD